MPSTTHCDRSTDVSQSRVPGALDGVMDVVEEVDEGLFVYPTLLHGHQAAVGECGSLPSRRLRLVIRRFGLTASDR